MLDPRSEKRCDSSDDDAGYPSKISLPLLKRLEDHCVFFWRRIVSPRLTGFEMS